MGSTDNKSRINNPKSKIAQLFCRHKHSVWCTRQWKNGYSNIRGEERFLICEDCGKEIDKMFLEYEGMGYK